MGPRSTLHPAGPRHPISYPRCRPAPVPTSYKLAGYPRTKTGCGRPAATALVAQCSSAFFLVCANLIRMMYSGRGGSHANNVLSGRSAVLPGSPRPVVPSPGRFLSATHVPRKLVHLMYGKVGRDRRYYECLGGTRHARVPPARRPSPEQIAETRLSRVAVFVTVRALRGTNRFPPGLSSPRPDFFMRLV